MQRFFQEHLTGILRPINEHVQELQEQTRALALDLARTDARVYGYLNKVEAHEHQLSGLKASHGDMGTALLELRADVARGGERHAALEQHHGKTRGDLDCMARDFQSTASSLRHLEQALRQAADDSAASAQTLRDELSEASRRAARLEASFAQLDSAHRGLAGDVGGPFAQGLKEATGLGALNAQRLEKLAAGMAFQREDHERLAGDVRGSQQRFAQELRGAREASETASVGLASLRTEVCSAARADELEQDLRSLQEKVQKQHGVFSARTSKLDDMFGQVSKGLTEMMSSSSAPGGDDDGEKDDANVLADLGKVVVQTASDVKQQALYLRHLREADDRRGRHLQGLEERVAGLSECARDLTQRAETSEERLGVCESSQREAAAAVQVQRLELERAHKRQQQLSTSLGGATANIRLVNDHVRLVGQDVARQAAKVDVAHEYIDGLGHGLQDTHRCVMTGQEGLLAPKSGSLTARGLPKLVWSGLSGAGRD